MSLLFDDLWHAYRCAVRGKSKRKEIQERNTDLEKNMKQLHAAILSGSYQIGRSRRYIVKDPVVREIVVIPFRDRIIQHLISFYLTPLFEKQFIYDNYANRVGKGCLFGIRRVDHMMRSVSHNYTREARVLKCDIQSCFMSIDRTLVRECINRRVFAEQVERSKPLLLGLLQKSLFHEYVDGRQDCTTFTQRQLLPKNKSMQACKKGSGLPLGNLTSHLFAQIVLHQLDLFVKHELKISGYGRYVDDFVLIHHDHTYLKSCVSRMNTFLHKRLGLVLHPKKIYLQPVTTGVSFLGVYLKPRCRLIGKRTIHTLEKKIRAIQHNNFTVEYGEKLTAMINAYFGLMCHHASFCLRKACIKTLSPFWYDELRVRRGYLSVKPRRKIVHEEDFIFKTI